MAGITGQQETFPQHQTPPVTQPPWDTPVFLFQVTWFFVGQAETSDHSLKSDRPELDPCLQDPQGAIF